MLTCVRLTVAKYVFSEPLARTVIDVREKFVRETGRVSGLNFHDSAIFVWRRIQFNSILID